MRHRQSAIRALTDVEIEYLAEAASLATQSVTVTEPHPNAACLLVSESNDQVFRGTLWAQGCESSEVQAARKAGNRVKGGTAFLNLECGDCHGDDAAVRALIDSGVKRCVIGMLHPLPHFRGKAIDELQKAGIDVEVAEGELPVVRSVYEANEGLIHRAAFDRPMGILKYAMTMDGKIAATSGHSAWVSSKDSRQIVFATRASVNAVIVGGQTVRRDNPRLTTRREEGWQPARIVMSRTLDLPRDAEMWDVSVASTIVATQRGANRPMQKFLMDKGVTVVEFDFLTPEVVSKYCQQRGFLSVLWECGGALAAPAVSDSAVHKIVAFIAPKIIGGERAPTPVGDLGFVEMTQAIPIVDYSWRQVGPDVCMTGYISHLPSLVDDIHSTNETGDVVTFFKTWDRHGILSNFSPHPIEVEGEVYATVEHWYQSQKLAGVPGYEETMIRIKESKSPEEAAMIGRRAERQGNIRNDWTEVKLDVMEAGLRRKFLVEGPPRQALLATGTKHLVESSPHDYFWGRGWNKTGSNWLGRLLMKIRDDHTI